MKNDKIKEVENTGLKLNLADESKEQKIKSESREMEKKSVFKKEVRKSMYNITELYLG